MADPSLTLATWLASTDGQAALAEAAELAPWSDPLAASTALARSRPDLTPEQARAALAQADLAHAARTRHGRPDADRLLFTRDGLEQGTRAEVAELRARTLASSGVRHVVDLTAGLGLDARAFATAGLRVTAVERDPHVAALLAHNLRGTDSEVLVADALDVAPALLASLDPTDAVFVDPARRDPVGARDLSTGRARAERDPARWSPPLPAVLALPHPRIVVKAAPATAVPDGWQAQWTSVQRTVVECSLWSWPALPADRVAAVMRAPDEVTIVTPSGVPTPVAGQALSFVLEPDPALVAAGLLDALGDTAVSRLADDSTWLTSDHQPDGSIGDGRLRSVVRAYRVIDVLSGSTAQQRALLRSHGVTHAVVKSKDTGDAPARVLGDLRLAEGGAHVIVVTRIAGRRLMLLTTPAS